MRRDSLSKPGFMPWSRRAFLKSLPVGAFGTLTRCTTPPFPTYSSQPLLQPEIDIHCHVINIRDLPAFDMIMYVLVENRLLKPLARPLAKLVVAIAKEPAPTGAIEIDELKRMVASGATSGQDDPSRDPLLLFARGVNRFVEDHIDSPRAKRRPRIADENRQALDRIYETFLGKQQEGIVARSAAEKSLFYQNHALEVARAMQGKAPADDPAAIGPRAEFDSYGALFTNLFMEFAPLCSMYRYRTASYLENFVGPPRPVRLVTPACLDVTNWIKRDWSSEEPPSATPIAEQAKILELLSLVQPAGVALHGFVGFDPAQCVHDSNAGSDGLRVVKKAILEQGLVGVKLYPAIGFRAIGNEGCKFPGFVSRKVPRFGARLDEALMTLYTFCRDHHVPIMAHCAPTIGPPDALERAHPEHWQHVLDMDGFQDLRLNLAHSGGLFFWYEGARKHAWTDKVADMLACGRYRNLYADVGDVANFLTGVSDEDTKNLIANMRTMPKAARNRLMYGTDWPLLARLPDFKKYRTSFEPVLSDLLGTTDLSPFFFRNAASFLGLTSDTRTRQRLADFYRSKQRAWPDTLDAFLQPPSARIIA